LRKRNHWPCRTFAIALPDGKLPTLLRRVAKRIETLEPDFVHNIVVKTEPEYVVATVYFSPKRKSSTKTIKKRSPREPTGRKT